MPFHDSANTYSESITYAGGSHAISHGLSNANPTVEVRRESDSRMMSPSQFKGIATDANTVTISNLPANGNYTVIVVG